jgi:hypothetical protein
MTRELEKRHQLLKIAALLLFILLSIFSLANEPISRYKSSISTLHNFSVYIMDQGQCSASDFSAMLLYYNPDLNPTKADYLARVYVTEATKEGVNQDIAFSQMCLETGFLNFKGNVKPHQNNFCGLGAVSAHSNGEHFPDIETGVRAHIQHLKAYASTLDLILPNVDNRFRFVKRGIAPTIYELPGRWASDKEYAVKLESLLSRLFLIRYQTASRETNK